MAVKREQTLRQMMVKTRSAKRPLIMSEKKVSGGDYSESMALPPLTEVLEFQTFT